MWLDASLAADSKHAGREAIVVASRRRSCPARCRRTSSPAAGSRWRRDAQPSLQQHHLCLNRCAARVCCKSVRYWLTAVPQQFHTDKRRAWRRPTGTYDSCCVSPTHHSHQPSPPHSSIPGLKPSFSANPSHSSLPFLFRTDTTDSPVCLPILLSLSVYDTIRYEMLF